MLLDHVMQHHFTPTALDQVQNKEISNRVWLLHETTDNDEKPPTTWLTINILHIHNKYASDGILVSVRRGLALVIGCCAIRSFVVGGTHLARG